MTAHPNSYLRREKAKACPVHTIVMDLAGEDLNQQGYFSKEDILERCGMGAMDESIRWDYIREFLCEDNDIQLLPVASRFFLKQYRAKKGGPLIDTAEERLRQPGKYLATGHGKKTAGYVNVDLDGGVMAIKSLKTKHAITNGQRTSVLKLYELLKKRKLITGTHRPPLPKR